MRFLRLLFAVLGLAVCAWAQGSADDFVKRGNDYLEKGDFDHAIQEYGEAIRLRPSDAEAVHNRGAAYVDKGDYDRAIQDFTEAIRLKPDFVEALYNRGHIYAYRRDLDHALQDLTEAIRLKPDYAEALYLRGAVYAGKGDNDRANQDLSAALRLNPSVAIPTCAFLSPTTAAQYLSAGGHAASSDSAKSVTPETGFVSENRYSNAFFGFVLTWPQEAPLRFDAEFQKMVDTLAKIPLRHILFAGQYGASLVMIMADECPAASADDARRVLPRGDVYRGTFPNGSYGPESVKIGGKQFWKDEYRHDGSVRYAATLDGYILQIAVSFHGDELLKKFVQSVEGLTFIEPGKAREMAGPDSRPPGTPPPGWDSGIVSGNTYTHPMLHFSYEFPAGWHVADQGKAEKAVEDSRAAAQHWDVETRKMYADDDCLHVPLTLTKYPEDVPGKDPNPRIFVIAVEPLLCMLHHPDPRWLGDPAKTDEIAQELEYAFKGAPFMPAGSKRVNTYSVDGHFMLEISGVSTVSVPGQKTPVELHTAFIVSPVTYYWLGWGLVTDSDAELQELRKIKFKIRLPPPVVPLDGKSR